jgi:ADP-heptose:LPS heptosyltransferase
MTIKIILKAYILKLIARKTKVEFDIKDAKKVLFLRYDRIGDMVITSSVFRELKLNYPEINITVIASKVNKDVLINNPYIDDIIINNKNNFFSDLPSLLKLRKKKFDVCIEFDHSVVPHAIIRLKIIKPKKIISIQKDGRYGVKAGELPLYDIYIEKEQHEHLSDIWLGVLKPFGINPKSKSYDLFISDKQNTVAQNYVDQYPSKFLVGINLEGAVEGKKIKFPEFYEICAGLYNIDSNIQIFVLSSPDNFKSYVKKVNKMKLNYVEVSYKTKKILDVAALISKLDLIVTPDTSIAHIASSFDKAVVTIHENNIDSYQLFAPISKFNRTVFSTSNNNINEFSVKLILEYCYEFIKLVDKEDYEQ